MSLTYPNQGIIPTGINVVPAQTGVVDLGSSALPFNAVYSDKVNDNTVVVGVYNEVPVGAVDGANADFNLTFSPVEDSVQLYSTGIYQYPSGVGASQEDYQIRSGNVIHFFNIPANGSPLIANYNYLG